MLPQERATTAPPVASSTPGADTADGAALSMSPAPLPAWYDAAGGDFLPLESQVKCCAITSEASDSPNRSWKHDGVEPLSFSAYGVICT